jgi:hypothetical protein
MTTRLTAHARFHDLWPNKLYAMSGPLRKVANHLLTHGVGNAARFLSITSSPDAGCQLYGTWIREASAGVETCARMAPLTAMPIHLKL